MISELLKLSAEIQIALASGYAAYLIAYTGLREPHRTIDIAFIALVFSLVATAILGVTGHWGTIASGTAAFLGSVISGLLWRKWGRASIRWCLRALNITWSDDDPSALATLTGNTRYLVTQIAVQLDDGTWLSCEDVSQFTNAPFGPCLLGPNGDVALYLTHEERPGEESKQMNSVRDVNYGDRITYVPAARIRCLTMRHRRESSRS